MMAFVRKRRVSTSRLRSECPAGRYDIRKENGIIIARFRDLT